MTDVPIIEEVIEDPCIDATDLVEEVIDLDDEPYQEIIILDLSACVDDLCVN